jgi:hypothetical protein
MHKIFNILLSIYTIVKVSFFSFFEAFFILIVVVVHPLVSFLQESSCQAMRV